MNSATQKALTKVLDNLKTVSFYLPYPCAAELADSCSDAIEAIQNDDTVTETGISDEEHAALIEDVYGSHGQG
jgi:hypothetical protein